MQRYIISEYADDAPKLIKEFLVYMATIKGKSPHTAYEYFLDLRMFFRYILHNRKIVPLEMPLEEISIKEIDINFIKTISISDAYDFLGYIAQERPRQQNSSSTEYGLCSSSRARKVASLRAFFKYLTHKLKILDSNPMEMLDSPSQPKKLPQYLTLDDSVSLLKHIDGTYASRDYCIITLFLNCGMRVSELANMNLQDIQGDILRIIGKGNKERSVYLNDACKESIEAYLPDRVIPHPADKNAFFTSRNRNRLSIPTIKWLVKKHINAAGLDTRKYSAHKLRHTAATLMYQNGVDIRTLQSVLGHTNMDTTMMYTHLTSENLKFAAINNPLSSIKPSIKIKAQKETSKSCDNQQTIIEI